MYAKESLIDQIIPRLKKLKFTEKILLTTYKRNRSLTILKIKEDTFLFEQRGYWEKSFEVKEKKLSKKLKQVLREEFPRSHKVRVYFLKKEENILENLKKL